MVSARVRPLFLLFRQRTIAPLAAPLRARSSNPAIKDLSVLELDNVAHLAHEIGKLKVRFLRSQFMTDFVSNRDQNAIIVARWRHRQKDQMLAVFQTADDLFGGLLSLELCETLLNVLNFERTLLKLVLADDVFHSVR